MKIMNNEHRTREKLRHKTYWSSIVNNHLVSVSLASFDNSIQTQKETQRMGINLLWLMRL